MNRIKKIIVSATMLVMTLLLSGCMSSHRQWINRSVNRYEAEYSVDLKQRTKAVERFEIGNKGEPFRLRIRKDSNIYEISKVSGISEGEVTVEEDDRHFHLYFAPEEGESGHINEYIAQYEVLTRNERDFWGNDYYSQILINPYGNQGLSTVEIRLTLPKAVDWEKAKLYLMEYGEIVKERKRDDGTWTETRESKVKQRRLTKEDGIIDWQGEGKTLTIRAEEFPADSGLRIQIPLGRGYFENNHFYATAPFYSKILLGIAVIIGLIAIAAAFSELVYMLYMVFGTLGLIGVHLLFVVISGYYRLGDRNAPWAIAFGIFTLPVISYFFSGQLNNRKLERKEWLIGGIAAGIQIIMGIVTFHLCFNNRLLELSYIPVVLAHAGLTLAGKRTLTLKKGKKGQSRKGKPKKQGQMPGGNRSRIQQQPAPSMPKSGQDTNQAYNPQYDLQFGQTYHQGYYQTNGQSQNGTYHQINDQPYNQANNQTNNQAYNRPYNGNT